MFECIVTLRQFTPFSNVSLIFWRIGVKTGRGRHRTLHLTRRRQCNFSLSRVLHNINVWYRIRWIRCFVIGNFNLIEISNYIFFVVIWLFCNVIGQYWLHNRAYQRTAAVPFQLRNLTTLDNLKVILNIDVLPNFIADVHIWLSPDPHPFFPDIE